MKNIVNALKVGQAVVVIGGKPSTMMKNLARDDSQGRLDKDCYYWKKAHVITDNKLKLGVYIERKR